MGPRESALSLTSYNRYGRGLGAALVAPPETPPPRPELLPQFPVASLI